ncbi:hypothetical protein L1987_79544 [Smallanthus sonchifolius]|uniref:Uncharacterized protein n=1 Tax=Smallanthus sonchifolius TaxID=185202 RepID=A0ACB8ZGB0_9ASTR|nr:hypothetical protein L1987_79544 [Smallanthus sonchifolius]
MKSLLSRTSVRFSSCGITNLPTIRRFDRYGLKLDLRYEILLLVSIKVTPCPKNQRLSRGLKNALYSIRAVDLTEELFGTLVLKHPDVSVDEPERIYHQVLGLQTGEIQDNLGQEPLREARLHADSRTMEGEESEYNQVLVRYKRRSSRLVKLEVKINNQLRFEANRIHPSIQLSIVYAHPLLSMLQVIFRNACDFISFTAKGTSDAIFIAITHFEMSISYLIKS